MNIIQKDGMPDLPLPNYQYLTRTEDALRVLPEIEKYELIEIDTEATALDPLVAKVVLLQIGVLGKAFVFDVREGNVDAKIFKPLLESSVQLKLLQNAVYDYEVLKTNFGIELTRIYDTMLAEQLSFLGLHPKASLDYLVGKYLHMRMPKDIATSFADYRQEYQEYQLRYAANDVSVLREIYNLQLPKLRQDGLMRVAKLEFDFVKPLAEMELNGMLLDVPRWQGILDETVVERDKHRIQLRSVFEDTMDQTAMFGVSLMNFNSPAQVIQGLHKMGVDVKSTDVKELSKHKKHPIVKLLLDYRKYEKFITTYGEPMINRINPLTGRLHTSFRQMVDTGRLSSSNPNLQNIPKEQKYRSCFVARPGYKLITCLARGSEVLSDKGLIPIDRLTIGDKVFTHKGRFNSIVNISKMFVDNLYELKTFYNVDSHRLTGEHPLYVYFDGKFEWVNTEDIKIGDYTCFPVNNLVCSEEDVTNLYKDNYKVREGLKIGNRKFIKDHLLTKDFWRLCGYWLGDGCCQNEYMIKLSFGSNDKKNCIEDVINISRKLFNYDPVIYQEDNLTNVFITDKNLSKLFSNFYVEGTSGEKHIPIVLETLPLEFQKNILLGYFGADGHYYNGVDNSRSRNSVGIVSISKKLLQSMQRILLRFKIITIVQQVGKAGKSVIKGREVNVKDKYELIGGIDFVKFLGLKSARGFHDYKSHKKGFFVDNFVCFPVKSKTKIKYSDYVYNLEVGIDNSFCLHFLTTHNCDMSQAELRILGEFSGDPVFLESFAKGLDLHTRTASDLFGLTYEEVMADKKLDDNDPKKKNYRSNVKALNFGLIYGLTRVGLSLAMGTSESDAQKLINAYFKRYPRIKQWLDKAARSAVINGYSTTISGRRRYYVLPEPTDPTFKRMRGSVERRGKNHPIQGCLAFNTYIKGVGNIGNCVDKVVEIETGFGSNKVLGVCSGSKEMYELKLSNGIKLVITLDHEIPVCNNEGMVDKKISEIDFDEDMLIIPLNTVNGKSSNISGYEYEKKHWRETYVKYKYPHVMNDKLSFVIGCLIGDGNYSEHNNFNFVCNSVELELFNKYNKYIVELFGYDPSINSVKKKRSLLFKSQASSVVLRGFLNHVGLDYVINRSKSIPRCFFTETLKNKGSLLDGLFSTDGGVIKGSGPNYTTVSEQLANDIQQLLLSIGINSNLKTYTNEYGFVYRIQIHKRFIAKFLTHVGASIGIKRNKLHKELLKFRGKDQSLVPKFIPKTIYNELYNSDIYKHMTYNEKCHLRRFKLGSCSFTSWRKFFNYIDYGKNKEFLGRFTDCDFCKPVSLKKLGYAESFDLICKKDPKYFIANGVIVHNSNADTIKQAMVHVVDRIESYDARLLSTVHDEVIVEVRDDQVDEVTPIVEQAVIDGFGDFFSEVEMHADADVADYWVKG